MAMVIICDVISTKSALVLETIISGAPFDFNQKDM